MDAIQGLKGIAPIERKLGTPKSEGFDNMFADAVERVEQYRVNAEEAAGRFLNGESEEIHQVILAGQRAEIAFEAFLQVRNKIVQAYQEVMRMQM